MVEGDMAAPGLPSAGDGSDESKVPADFVRKLFNMLEEPRYNNIVCWGPRKDSFIVLEQGRITKEILPNHFKHSNFASFVRQLNKYGFHKKKEDKDGGPPLHPPDVWEFSHPDFSWANRDSLDKIRRKVPASRKPQPASDDNGTAVAQVNMMAETMVATSLQIERLNGMVEQLSTQNNHLFKELKQLQHAHHGTQQVNQQLLTWAFAQDDLKLKNRLSMHSNHSGQFGALPDGNDEPSAELKKARELMNTFGMGPMAPNGYQEVAANMTMGHFQNQGDSPPDSTTGPAQVMFTSQSISNSAIMPSAHAMMPNTFDNLVYPTGQNNGIDPFHPDRANNLPYPLQSQNVEPVTKEGPPDHGNHGLWANGHTPRILLVEDDKTCSRIGAKFLSSAACTVECAQDGEVATNKLNSDPERFDLIFMDIIMPKLDGISATIYIRSVNPHVPIIAMTSNIRAEDMATYYQWGMNDILAKPFTRDGMVKILKKYCGHMLKNPEAHAHELEPNGTPVPFSAAPSASTPTFALATSNMKLETTPINSPAATSASWHSPGNMMQQASPNLDAGGYMTSGVHVTAGGPQLSQMVKAQAPVGAMQAPPPSAGGMPPQQQQGLYTPRLQNAAARGQRMPDMGADEKRQRLSYSAVHTPGTVSFTRR